MRAVKGNLGHSLLNTGKENRGISRRETWRFPVLAQRAASEGPRWTRAVEDQSAPIPEKITSERGGKWRDSWHGLCAPRALTIKRRARAPTLVLCSRNARPVKGLVRRPHVDQHGCPSRREKQASLEGAFISFDARNRGSTRLHASPSC